jgi:hypothetical protein
MPTDLELKTRKEMRESAGSCGFRTILTAESAYRGTPVLDTRGFAPQPTMAGRLHGPAHGISLVWLGCVRRGLDRASVQCIASSGAAGVRSILGREVA